MLIQIESDRGQPPSWAMIELQGEVERKLENTDRAFDVGRLESNSDVGAYKVSRFLAQLTPFSSRIRFSREAST